MTDRRCDRDPRGLERLLKGQLTRPEEDEAERHLEACSACREALERLAADRTWWHDLRNLEAAEAGEVLAQVPLGFLEPSDEPGTIGRLGPYLVEGVLGRGGMGIVLKAFDPVLRRAVAIKVIAPELAASGSARRRFAREARAAAAIAHEHVVAIHGVAESPGGIPYLVMAYIAGPSLQERIDRDGPFGVEAILRVGMQAAAGLASAHAQGLVHRDVKPSNILLENGVERVKITDFGLARAVDEASLSQSGLIAGTPLYMSPEQARGESVDARADLFSLGSVLYAMATGHSPFRAKTPLAVLRRVNEDRPRPIRELNPEIPPWLAQAIGRLLAKKPEDRFQAAAEVADLFGRCLAHLQDPSKDGTPFRPVKSPGARLRRWAVAASLLLAVTALTAEAAGLTRFFGTILRIRTAEGTLVVNVSDPGVNVSVDDKDLSIQGAGVQEVRLRLGQHRVRATDKDGRPIRDELVSITRDNKPVVDVHLEPNAPAVAARPPRIEEKVEPWAEPDFLDAFRTVARRLGQLQLEPRAEPAPAPAPEEAAIDPSRATVLRLPEWPRPEAPRPDRPMSSTVIAGPEIPGLTESDALRPVPLDDPSPAPLWPGSSVTWQAYSADGKTLAIASNFDRKILLYDVATRRRKATLQGHQARVWQMAFSPDGKKLVAASGHWGQSADSGEVRLWDLELPRDDRKLVPADDMPLAFKVDQGVVLASKMPLAFTVAWSPDGRTIAHGGWDDMITLHDVAAGKVRARMKGHGDAVRMIAYSPDGKTLASASWDGTVRLWDPEAARPLGEPLATLRAGANGVAFSPDGRLLAGVVQDPFQPGEDRAKGGQIRVWEVATRRVVADLVGHPKTTFYVGFSPDGRTMVTSGGEKNVTGEIKMWDVATWTERESLGGFRSWIGCAMYSPDGRTLIAGADHGGQRAEVRVYDTSRALQSAGTYLPDCTPVWSIAYAPDGKTLAAGVGPPTRHGRLWLIDLKTGGSVAALQAHLGIRSIGYSADGREVVVGSYDGSALVCDAQGKELARLRIPGDTVNAVAISGDGRQVAVAARDGSTELCDFPFAEIRGVNRLQETWCLAFSPDGKVLAAGQEDGEIRLHEGRKTTTIHAHALGVAGVAFSPDGKTLATAGWDKAVKLFDLAGGQEVATFEGHDRPARAVAFSPDGRTLASCDGSDGALEAGSVIVWDVASRTMRSRQALPTKVHCVAFSPDGKILASGCEDGLVRSWTMDGPAAAAK